jgi:hypothetical protein
MGQMVRYVCDVCGATADKAMPETWTTVEVMGPAVSDPSLALPPSVTLAVCQQHDVHKLLGAAVSA